MKVTVDEIVKVRSGRPKSYRFSDPRALRAAQSLVWYCNKCHRPAGISRFSVHANWNELIVTITAVPESESEAEEVRP